MNGGTGGTGGQAGAAAAFALGQACLQLQACCVTLGDRADGCAQILKTANGDERTCTDDYQLLCPQHTCTDLVACCDKLTGAAQTGCQNAAAAADKMGTLCSIFYAELKCMP